MRDDELQELVRLAAAATPGPWLVHRCNEGEVDSDRACGIDPPRERRMVFSDGASDECHHIISAADAAFIAAAREAVPALCLALAKARGELNASREQLATEQREFAKLDRRAAESARAEGKLRDKLRAAEERFDLAMQFVEDPSLLDRELERAGLRPSDV